MGKKNSSKIKVSIGVAKGKDTYQTALKAAKDSLDGLRGATFSILYADSNYDEKEILKAGNEILGNTWIGCSTDTQLTSTHGFEQGTISVLTISSEYLHFGVGVVDKYHKNPASSGEKAIQEAMKNVHVDHYVDPYIQFRRSQTKSFHEIVRIPPYFILTLICGVKFDKQGNPLPGMEAEFLEGVFKITGPNIPIIGGSSSTDWDKYTKEKITNNFQFANGKLYYDAAIIVFVVSDLYFAHSFTHGYCVANNVALLTKVDKTGHIIQEINGKPAVEEYARILKVSVDELTKNPFKYILAHPLGVLDTFGNVYIKSGAPNPDRKTWYTLTKVQENTASVVVNYDPKKTKEAVYYALKEADDIHSHKEIALGLVFSCCGRKALLGKDVTAEIDIARRKYKGVPLFGFHTFGEIGAKMSKSSQVCNQSVSSLIIYNKLLTE
ncbi:FIST C-terminal domain-containing protein [Candidatus Woesearchaeota archaeon]|nr:FIST C-terminal domain-containing protein [Candidatus Woesearchaeota archaeon]